MNKEMIMEKMERVITKFGGHTYRLPVYKVNGIDLVLYKDADKIFKFKSPVLTSASKRLNRIAGIKDDSHPSSCRIWVQLKKLGEKKRLACALSDLGNLLAATQKFSDVEDKLTVVDRANGRIRKKNGKKNGNGTRQIRANIIRGTKTRERSVLPANERYTCLTPKEIGELIRRRVNDDHITSEDVNKHLVRLGYQERIGKRYKINTKGRSLGEYKWEGNVQHVVWYWEKLSTELMRHFQ